MGYSRLQVSAGEIIVYEVRRLSAAGARKAAGAGARHQQAQPLLLRDAVSLLWMLVVASREVLFLSSIFLYTSCNAPCLALWLHAIPSDPVS